MAQKVTQESAEMSTWYVDLKGAETNEGVMMHMANFCGATAEKLHYDKLCADRKRRNLLEIDQGQIDLIKQSARTLHFSFGIFLSIGDRLPQQWKLNPAGKTLARTQPVREVARKLESMKQ